MGPRMARGGTGGVYRGIDQRLDRTVALKIMHPHLTEDPTFVGRFAREARAAAQLSHPHVVSVTDQGETKDGLVYLVMEYVEGGTLRDVLERKKFLTPGQAFHILEQLVDGLASAHRSGLVHRDIKPENILMRTDGTVKVADFGLTRGTDQHTTTGAVLGTVAYAAPELVLEQPVGTQADVYSVGILAWEMLAGRRPFTGNPWTLARAHVEQPVPSLAQAVPGLDPLIVELIARWTAKEQRHRPTDATELVEQLAAVRSALSHQALDHVPPGWVQGPGPLAPVTGDPGTSVLPESAPAAVPIEQPQPTTALPVDPTEATEAMTVATSRSGGGTVSPELSVFDDTMIINRLEERGTEPATHIRDSHYEHQSPAETVPGTDLVETWRSDPHHPTVSLGRQPLLATAVGVAATVVLVCLAAFLGWLLGSGSFRTETVPPVQGSTPEQAQTVLAEEGFSNVRVYDRPSADIPAGSVVGTTPEEGTQMRVGEQLSVLVSSGPAQTTVPAVEGLTQEEATTRLEEANLSVGEVTTEFSSSPEGTITAASPAESTSVDEGSTVNLTISAGEQPEQVPNVIGAHIDQATKQLEDLGFTVQREDVAGGQLGRVVTQNQNGSTITLRVI